MARKSIVQTESAPDNGQTEELFPFGANAPNADPAGEPAPTDDTTETEIKPEADSATASEPAGPDPFDPASLRLSQSFAATIGVRKALLAVPIRKPDKAWFIRVHPDEQYRLQTAVIELKEDRGGETFLVAPALWPELAAESTFAPRAFFTAINRQGVVFLWPVRLPGPDGRVDEWSRTALEAAGMAGASWVRVAANMALGAYDVFEATGQLSEPEWPTVPFKELLRVAFKDRFITDLNHPVLRRLRGEV